MTHHFSFAFMGEIYPYSKGILPRIMEVGPMGSKMIIFPLNHGAMGGTVSTIVPSTEAKNGIPPPNGAEK